MTLLRRAFLMVDRFGARPSWKRTGLGLVILVVFVGALYVGGDAYHLSIANTWLFACLGALALNVLMGTAGQVSIGNAAFLAVGAFSAAFYDSLGVAFPLDVVLSAFNAALAGAIVGIPALRLKGLTLALGTLSAHFIVLFVVNQYQIHNAGVAGFFVPLTFSGNGQVQHERMWLITLLGCVCALILVIHALVNGKTGRAWRFVRDHESVAGALGINGTAYKMGAFIFSSAVIGAQGALMAHYAGQVGVESFTLLVAVQYLAMILIGGRDSVLGSVLGAGVVATLPILLPSLMNSLTTDPYIVTRSPQFAMMVYGALLILFIISSPDGLVGWLRSAWYAVARRVLRSNETAGVTPSHAAAGTAAGTVRSAWGEDD